jgi:hypothetical protein
VVTRYRRQLGRRGDVHALLAHQPFDANPTFESTFEVARELTLSIDSFVEYVGDYPNHVQPTQVIDCGPQKLNETHAARANRLYSW